MIDVLPMSDPSPSPPARNGHDAALMAEARALIEQTIVAQAAIAYRLGIPASTLSMWKLREGWVRPEGAPRYRVPPGASATTWTAVPAGDTASRRRTRLISRLYRAFERQLAELEARAPGTDGLSTEKDARALGILAGTLEKLIALELDDGAKAVRPEPVDRDELNAELARRITRWAEGGEGPE